MTLHEIPGDPREYSGSDTQHSGEKNEISKLIIKKKIGPKKRKKEKRKKKN